MKVKNVILLAVSLALMMIHFRPSETEYMNHWEGDGSYASPFLIQTADDLLTLMEMVNYMNADYQGAYFLQTDSLDLSGVPMDPIGLCEGETFFFGVYDGGGHCLENLEIDSYENAGLFGCLGGTVINLGIRSGRVSGDCAGSIAACAADPGAMIINCYSRCAVQGNRAGGIADNFAGTILNCWSHCDLDGNQVGGIVSYNAAHIARCASATALYPSTFFGTERGSVRIAEDGLNGEALLNSLQEGLGDCAAAQRYPAVMPVLWTAGADQPVLSRERFSASAVGTLGALLDAFWDERNRAVPFLCLLAAALWAFARCAADVWRALRRHPRGAVKG